MKFKTNIKCEGCIAKVTPVLDAVAGKGNWDVDLHDPSKTLFVKDSHVSASEVKARLADVGYEAVEEG